MSKLVCGFVYSTELNQLHELKRFQFRKCSQDFVNESTWLDSDFNIQIIKHFSAWVEQSIYIMLF